MGATLGVADYVGVAGVVAVAAGAVVGQYGSARVVAAGWGWLYFHSPFVVGIFCGVGGVRPSSPPFLGRPPPS